MAIENKPLDSKLDNVLQLRSLFDYKDISPFYCKLNISSFTAQPEV